MGKYLSRAQTEPEQQFRSIRRTGDFRGTSASAGLCVQRYLHSLGDKCFPNFCSPKLQYLPALSFAAVVKCYRLTHASLRSVCIISQLSRATNELVKQRENWLQQHKEQSLINQQKSNQHKPKTLNNNAVKCHAAKLTMPNDESL